MKSLMLCEDRLIQGATSPLLVPTKDFKPAFIPIIDENVDFCMGSPKQASRKLDGQYENSVTLTDLKYDPVVQSGEGFCLAISLHDGTALHVTSTITNFLGYPKDMLIGQCILNYLYPRDRPTFASHLSQGLQSRFPTSPNPTEGKFVFFVRIRQYKGLSAGFGISDKKPKYLPFQLTCFTKDVLVDKRQTSSWENPILGNDGESSDDNVQTVCLIASAIPIRSAYTTPNELSPAMTPFSTRHSSSCHMSHVDSLAIPYLGYLPQDLVGYPVFDFYKTEDLSLLRDIYELVLREQGSSFRSKPYRFKAFNGDFITIETDWSCFINPWTRKLEFVLGQHRVLNGPKNPNVFDECSDSNAEEMTEEVLHVQNDIKYILAQPVKKWHGVNTSSMRRKKRLAAFVSNIIDGIEGGAAAATALKECSCSDLGSVVMGEISPHQDDSEPSEETPTLFQEIRLQDNIERFFASQPKTNCAHSSSEGSGSSSNQKSNGCNSNSNGSSSPDHQTRTPDRAQDDFSSQNCEKGGNGSTDSGVGQSGNGSREGSGNGRDGSNEGTNEKQQKPQIEEIPQAVTYHNSPKKSACAMLTEEILTAHNKVFNKQLRSNRHYISTATNATPGENTKKKRALTSPDLKATHKKQQKVKNDVTNDKRRADDFQTGTFPQFANFPMPPFTINPSFSLGIPMIPVGNALNTLCHSCSSNLHQTETTPNLMMPMMCFGIPMYPNLHSNVRQNAKIQTDSLGKKYVEIGTNTSKQNSTNAMSSSGEESMGKDNNSGEDSEMKQSYEGNSNSDTSLSISFGSSSLLKSDGTFSSDSGEELRKSKPSLKEPSWMEGIDCSDSQMYRYKMPIPDVNFTLKKDLAQLSLMKQPKLVRKQLTMLSQERNIETLPSTKDVGFDVEESEVNKEIEKREWEALHLIGASDDNF